MDSRRNWQVWRNKHLNWSWLAVIPAKPPLAVLWPQYGSVGLDCEAWLEVKRGCWRTQLMSGELSGRRWSFICRKQLAVYVMNNIHVQYNAWCCICCVVTKLHWSVTFFKFQIIKVRACAEELKSRVPECSVEKASKATLQSHQEQHELVTQDLERELSSLTLLRQYALSLLHDVEVSVPTTDLDQLPSLKEIKAVQDQFER